MTENSMPTKYQSSEIEDKWYRFWEDNGYFKPDMTKGGEPYTIVIPPPNVTGILHMGHALNNTIQDILIRWHRMTGVPTLWVPGTDHAGIATQNVVERKLKKEQGKNRHEVGRGKFVEEVWKWKEEHGSAIVKQLKSLGASCDWKRERFTMDEGLSKAVREAFVRLYEKGLIYQGNYIINWCPHCLTALSDEEAEHKEMEGTLYYVKYPVKDGGDGTSEHITVATTRPETMLGDTAVAIHPGDERYLHLKEKRVILPLVNREIPVIEDDHVDPEFGSGIVKITPAHDPNDFQIGKRHSLEEVNVMHPDGKINENGGPYAGMDRHEARKKIVEDLETQGLLVKKISHLHAVGHCYRCHTMVEPRISKQWFIKMKPLAEPAIKAHKKGKVRFVPERWNKVYLGWLENIRDWCISRQIWWGHRIPVWYCADCDKKTVTVADPAECEHCKGKNITCDPDVLDTWCSSWLWPFSTLGWPDKTEDLKRFYPTSDLVTAPEIIFFWVARMIMAGLEFMGDVPFSTVYIHGTVRTESGQKMSKSLGNAIDPLHLIKEIGADALRFSIIMLTASGQDAYLSREKFEIGRNFSNKIWNASRFALMNMEELKKGTVPTDIGKRGLSPFSTVNQWIISRLNSVTKEVDDDLKAYRLNDVANTLYHFIWGDLCDWYIELSKPVLFGKRGDEAKKETQGVLFYVLERSMRLLHPLMPHLTEEIWQRLKEYTSEDLGPTIMKAPWPEFDENLSILGVEDKIKSVKLAITELRKMLILFGAEKIGKISGWIKSYRDKKIFEEFEEDIKELSKVDDLIITGDDAVVDNSFLFSEFSAEFAIYAVFEHSANLGNVREHINKQALKAKARKESEERKLSKFSDKTPKEIVDKVKSNIAEIGSELDTYLSFLKFLQGFNKPKS